MNHGVHKPTLLLDIIFWAYKFGEIVNFIIIIIMFTRPWANSAIYSSINRGNISRITDYSRIVGKKFPAVYKYENMCFDSNFWPICNLQTIDIYIHWVLMPVVVSS